MAIRIFKESINANLLLEVDLNGVSLEVGDGKYRRNVCYCGAVMDGPETECKQCGNTEFVGISTGNRWNRYSQPIAIKSKSLELVAKTNRYEVVETYIFIEENSEKKLELKRVEKTVAVIDINNLEILQRERCSIEKNEVDVAKFIRMSIPNMKDEAIANALTEAFHVKDKLFNTEREVVLAYKLLGYPSTMYILNDDNMDKYRVFFQKTFSKYNWNNSDYLGGKVCRTMNDFWKALGLPCDFEPYYASANFGYDYYYYSSRESRIEESDYHSLPEELQRTIKSAIEHQTISLSVVYDIVDWAKTQNEEVCVILAKYIKRHGMQYQGNVFYRFQEHYNMAVSNGYPIEDIIHPRKISMFEVMSLMSKRGFPESRINGFCDIFDLNPSFAFDMLGSKAQLKKAEAEVIYSKY